MSILYQHIQLKFINIVTFFAYVNTYFIRKQNIFLDFSFFRINKFVNMNINFEHSSFLS